MQSPSRLCPQPKLTAALQAAGQGDDAGLDAVNALLRDYWDDPTLHFLKGSLLAALKRYDDARLAMGRALEIAPDYPVARFQLGLLHLSSGNADAARQVWAPLDGLPAEDPLRLFARGLDLMARDEFDAARTLLEAGLAANGNGPMNADIRLILEQMDRPGPVAGGEGDATSSAHFLLAQQGARRTTH
ncbi:tetratricopeptide repeat protein [Caulobacter sp. DWR1-3-2b1]|uniref:tetratricopeptide repeat protein n=1 Tax=Caulobacter sp. DWR1-3-2b1 TaxID=2804670 RepID=UPI003CED89A4